MAAILEPAEVEGPHSNALQQTKVKSNLRRIARMSHRVVLTIPQSPRLTTPCLTLQNSLASTAFGTPPALLK